MTFKKILLWKRVKIHRKKKKRMGRMGSKLVDEIRGGSVSVLEKKEMIQNVM